MSEGSLGGTDRADARETGGRGRGLHPNIHGCHRKDKLQGEREGEQEGARENESGREREREKEE